VPSLDVRCQVLLPMDAVHDLLLAIQLNYFKLLEEISGIDREEPI
jgi:hypothetical protein